MAMTSMALTAEEAKREYGDCAPCSADGEDNGPKYPWGLSICLSNESLQKLGIGLIPVGTEVVIMAKAQITGTSERERLKGEKTQDMDIQLTAIDLAIGTGGPVDAGKLYPKD